MTRFEIDAWTIRAINRLLDGQAKEDSLVEFKTELPTPKQAARWIAGHANAARGEPILWIIGVDENQRQFSALPPGELSNWWTQVQSVFDETAPALQDQIVEVRSGVVHALVFDCNRLPFAIKNQAGGAVEREVPRREGTSTRSARRSNLIEILAPLVNLPRIDVLSGNFSTELFGNTDYRGSFSITLYLVPRPNQQLVFPRHEVGIGYKQHDRAHAITGPTLLVLTVQNPGRPSEELRSKTIVESASEIILHGPGMIRLSYSGAIPFAPFTHEPLSMTITMGEAYSRKTVSLAIECVFSRDTGRQTFWIAKI